MGRDLRDGQEEGENIPGLGPAWAKVLGRERSFMDVPESGGLTRQGWKVCSQELWERRMCKGRSSLQGFQKDRTRTWS